MTRCSEMHAVVQQAVVEARARQGVTEAALRFDYRFAGSDIQYGEGHCLFSELIHTRNGYGSWADLRDEAILKLAFEYASRANGTSH